MLPVLEVEGFQVVVGARRFALPRLRLEAGECAALFAPSGAGKSSILRSLFASNGTATGRVRIADLEFGDASAADRRRCLATKIAVLQQDAIAALDPFRTLLAQVAAATRADLGRCRQEFARLADSTESAFAERRPHEVSGGQAQRALFAVAALRAPALVVCDEPTANLDDASAARVAASLQELRRSGAAVLLATHDLRLVQALAPVVLVAKDDAFVPGEPELAAWPRAEANEPDAPVVLAARGLVVRRDDDPVLSGLDLVVRRGEVVAVFGASGQGKTTLLRALVGRLRPDAGSIERPHAPTSVQLVGQDAGGSLTPSRIVRSLVEEVAVRGFDLEAEAARLGLDGGVLDRTAASLSGGERRRAALLRALAVAPSVLLLDEPTASLDRASAVALVTALLAHRQRHGTALVLVTHDEGLGAAIAHRVLRLQGGTWQAT